MRLTRQTSFPPSLLDDGDGGTEERAVGRTPRQEAEKLRGNISWAARGFPVPC